TWSSLSPPTAGGSDPGRLPFPTRRSSDLVPYALSHAERRGVSPGSDLPPARERLATPVASSAAHHGGPRERLFHNAFFGPAAAQEHPLGGRPARRAGHVQRRCVHRAITGAAVQPLTWLPRGQWSRSGRTRGRPAFGRGTSSEIRTLSRPASVAEKNSGKTPREGRLPAPRRESTHVRSRQDPSNRRRTPGPHLDRKSVV